jgi:hypothetical protein
MKIIDWENNLKKDLKFNKVTDIEELKDYTTNPDNYSYNFSAEEISEDTISNEDFYAAYILNEREILKRDTIAHGNSGWTTTIVMIGSADKKEIDDYCVLGFNGFTQDDVRAFFDKYFNFENEEQKSKE